MGLAKIETGARSFFRSEEYRNAEVIVLDVHSIDLNVPSQYGERDQANTTATIFASAEDIASGTCTLIENCIIGSKYQVEPLKGAVGQTVAVKVAQSNPRPGQKPAWIWDSVDAATEASVEEYLDKRDAALAAAPSFT